MIDSKDFIKVYESRPFKIRNADEFEINNVLDLFVDPTDGLRSPFDFENSIIKGRMGTGKTMYLRANLSYYLSLLVPSLLEGSEIVLPIYIRLSDFQGVSSPEDIYKQIIVKIVEAITSVYLHFQDSKKLAFLHNGVRIISENTHLKNENLKTIIDSLSLLSTEEYIEKSTKALSGKAGLTVDFCSLSMEHKKEIELQIKKKPNPGISDIVAAYEALLKPIDGKLLILFDEAGSLNKSFFKEGADVSIFETLMNQLRTLNYIRTKVAVYPKSYSDVLTETRYGDAILLREDIKNVNGYSSFKIRAISLIEKYIANFSEINCNIEDIFDMENNNDEILEQIINASDGNMRRFIQLLDIVFNNAYKENNGIGKIYINHVLIGLREHARSMEISLSDEEIILLQIICDACKARNTYRFRFPNKSIDMQKYMNKSSEYNIINMVELGAGRKGTVYSVDYAYCCYKDIPTHYIKETERIDKTRNRKTGQWISKITTINDTTIEHAKMPGKIEGTIEYIGEDSCGFVKGDDNLKYFWTKNQIIENDKNKTLHIGGRLRFLPNQYEENLFAYYVEIL